MRRAQYWIVIGLAAAVAALGVAAPAGAKSHRKVPECVVPNLKGLSEIMARAASLGAGCKLGHIAAPGQLGPTAGVASQAPAPGRHLKAGAPVAITLKNHAARARAIVLWCAPNPSSSASYSSNCSSPQRPTVGNPRNPLHVRTGHELTFDAYASGSARLDVSPAGYLSYAISGPKADYTQSWFDAGQDQLERGCSHVSDDSGNAGGDCFITFDKPGTYVLTLRFTDTDRTYPNLVGPSVTIIVMGPTTAPTTTTAGALSGT